MKLSNWVKVKEVVSKRRRGHLLLLIIYYLLLTCTCPSLCMAREKDVGTTAAQFLKISPLARLSGMGGAYVALSDDATAFYSNPAGLSQIKDRQACFSYLSYLPDISLGQLSYLEPTNWGTLGANIHYLGHKDIDRFDNGGKSEGTFPANAKAIFFSFGKDILKNISCGFNLKLIRESIWNYDSNWAIGLDLGETYQTPLKDLRVGLLFQNIGTRLKFREKSAPLPFNFKLGTSYQVKNLALALDGNFPRDQKPYLAVGAEYFLKDSLYLRAGYCSGPQDKGSGLSTGFGLKWQDIKINYSYQPFDKLGSAHRFSFSTGLRALSNSSKEKEKPFKILDSGDWTKEQDRLLFSWTPLKEVKEYEYSLGYSPFKNDLLDWTSSKGNTRAEINIGLIEGKSYYLTVRGKKRRLALLSKWEILGTSDGIRADFTPPERPVVVDEGVFSQANGKISFKISTSDKLSGISEILYCVGKDMEEGDVVPGIVGRPEEEITISGLSLKDGLKYYISVRAKDVAGNISQTGVSDGIIVDGSPPVILFVKDEGSYTRERSRLYFEWEAQDKDSGISEYQYCIGTSPKKEDLIPFKFTLANQISEENLDLVNGQTYYLTLRARNKAGLFSKEVSSDGIKVDLTPPEVEVPADEGEQTESNTLSFKWQQAVDNESRVVSYWLCVGTEPNTCDRFDGEVGNLLSYEIKEAKFGKTYYARVKAKNEAGLWSDLSRSSDGIKVVPKSYRTANSNLRLEAKIIEDSFPGTTKILLKIKNLLLDEEIPVRLNNFTLITEGEGKASFTPQINPLSDSLLNENLLPAREKEDSLLFNTDKPAKFLLYQDTGGNNLSLDFSFKK